MKENSFKEFSKTKFELSLEQKKKIFESIKKDNRCRKNRYVERLAKKFIKSYDPKLEPKLLIKNEILEILNTNIHSSLIPAMVIDIFNLFEICVEIYKLNSPFKLIDDHYKLKCKTDFILLMNNLNQILMFSKIPMDKLGDFIFRAIKEKDEKILIEKETTSKFSLLYFFFFDLKRIFFGKSSKKFLRKHTCFQIFL